MYCIFFCRVNAVSADFFLQSPKIFVGRVLASSDQRVVQMESRQFRSNKYVSLLLKVNYEQKYGDLTTDYC